jgi:hypothetical protein
MIGTKWNVLVTLHRIFSIHRFLAMNFSKKIPTKFTCYLINMIIPYIKSYSISFCLIFHSFVFFLSIFLLSEYSVLRIRLFRDFFISKFRLWRLFSSSFFFEIWSTYRITNVFVTLNRIKNIGSFHKTLLSAF